LNELSGSIPSSISELMSLNSLNFPTTICQVRYQQVLNSKHLWTHQFTAITLGSVVSHWT
jgi:hypothetical protein